MAVKSFPRIVLVAAVSALPLLAATAPRQAAAALPRNQKHEVRHEIDHMEESWRTAMLAKDGAALDNLLSDDYTGITAEGAIQTKDQAVGNLKSGSIKITNLVNSDRKVRIYGSTAVVTSLAEISGTRDGHELTGRYRYTRVYVRNLQGQWKIVSFEASRIQEPGEHKAP
jgi:ketosteroid isomerase-like protein